MATFDKTFSVKNGIDVANTIIVDSSRNVSNIVLANITTANITTLVSPSLTNAYNQANAAYSTANTANTTAKAAYNEANTASGVAGSALTEAALAYGQANAAYGAANTANTNALNAYASTNLAYGQANTARTTANDAYGQANTARDTANGAYARANLVYGVANSAANTARVSANSGSTIVAANGLNFINTASVTVSVTSGVNGNANIAFSASGSSPADAYNQANAAYAQANAAYGAANTANTNALNAYAAANTAGTNALNAYGQANSAFAKANASANTVQVYQNGTLVLSNSALNFNNTATINVAVAANGTTQSNVSFEANASAFVTATGTVTLTNKTLEGANLTNGYTEEVFAVTGTTPALSPTNGSIQTWTLSAASTPTAGTWLAGQSMTLMVDDGTAYTINWSSVAVTWKTNGGVAPTLNTTGFTVIALWKVGTVIYGARIGDA